MDAFACLVGRYSFALSLFLTLPAIMLSLDHSTQVDSWI